MLISKWAKVMKSIVARAVPFDNAGTDFVSDNVQDALLESGVSASPGFNFGRSGNNSANTWMQVVGGVPSNRAGITVALNSPEIKQVFVANEDISTFDITIYEHEGNEVNLTTLTTVSIVSARSGSFTLSVPVTSGRQLAVRITNGSARNINVGLQLAGSSA
jgi:hypothetical protein